MKSFMIALGAAALLAGPVLAQDHERPDPDLNHDGKVTLAEFQAFQARRIDHLFERYDTNHDGKISRAEAEAGAATLKANGKPANPGMVARMFEMMDTNHDGEITRAEAEAAGVARFKQADVNHDGVLSGEELAIAMPHMDHPHQ